MSKTIYFNLPNAIYLMGAAFNCIVLFACCRRSKWNHLNIKFLIVSQCLCSLLVLANSAAMMFAENFPLESCRSLPAFFIVSLSLAIFNLTAFAVVKHRQIFQQRQIPLLVILLTIPIASVALEFPILYTVAERNPIFILEGSPCVNATMNAHVSSTVNVSSYAFYHILLQFVVPTIIIINRCVSIVLYLRKSEDKEDPIKQQRFSGGRLLLNIACVVVIVFLFLLAGQPKNNEKTLKVLNDIFQPFRYFFVSVFCFPLYLWVELYISSSKDTVKVNPAASGTDDDELLISA